MKLREHPQQWAKFDVFVQMVYNTHLYAWLALFKVVGIYRLTKI